MVTRDSRGKERKKYGQKGARKRFQFSKQIGFKVARFQSFKVVWISTLKL